MSELEEEARKEAEDRQSPGSRIVHEAVMREGFEELERPSSALAWSGLAAGLSMGFSMIVEGLLQAHLPDAEWRPLVAKLGYSVGFLIVILGRQQLYTENTLTPILPLMKERDGRTLLNVLRLWTVVLLTNLVGAAILAVAVARLPVFEPKTVQAFVEIAREASRHDFGAIVVRGIFGGWLIAMIVWLLPFASTARVWVILLMTYVVGLGGFSHVIVGSVEVFTLAALGRLPWTEALLAYTLPSFIGNTIGGVALVAAINHAQVVAGRGKS